MDDLTDEAAGIYTRESPYLDRYVQMGIASDRIISMSFPRTPEDNAASEHPLLSRVFAYLEGKRDDFADIDVGLTVPTPDRAVLKATRGIPYGTQVSVEQLARTVPDLASDDESHETVRTALANNPIPLVIPDHRVRDAPSAAPPEIEQRLRSLEGL
ncbi:MGMT family protein [Halocatena marina]|uniref:MGMT family protein n=1 Tax=Halocatena marina TaxID=2934937 RepID=A0ABD5YQ02_9EURY|nr:MGMT family protein [Halocatena marina]